MVQQDDHFDRLCQAVLCIDTVDECRRFFEDLCTVNEIIAISQRLRVAEMLRAGKNYNSIANETGASTATIARVNRAFNYGSGGYKAIMDKMNTKKEQDEV